LKIKALSESVVLGCALTATEALQSGGATLLFSYGCAALKKRSAAQRCADIVSDALFKTGNSITRKSCRVEAHKRISPEAQKLSSKSSIKL